MVACLYSRNDSLSQLLLNTRQFSLDYSYNYSGSLVWNYSLLKGLLPTEQVLSITFAGTQTKEESGGSEQMHLQKSYWWGKKKQA